jgi:6-phosphogluconate dehydrogenase
MALKIGMIGLGPMGKNLAHNMQNNGITVVGYAPSESTRTVVRAEGLPVSNSYEELMQHLGTPRIVWVMVPDKAVDSVLQELTAHLHKGDIIIEGGNSHFTDTDRRVTWAAQHGYVFIGTGVSGGEEGALRGPCIMPGGEKPAYAIVAPILERIAAKVDGEPCVAYMGPRGAGHFVKMVHNGIEYAIMQAIAECYTLLHDGLKRSDAEITAFFTKTAQGRTGGFLTEITAAVVATIENNTGKPLVHSILDTAGQKGTGKWTSQAAYDLGVPVHTISAALLARIISSQKQERVAAAQPRPPATIALTDTQIEEALYSAMVIAYAQGFALLQAGSNEYGYELDLATIAQIWRGGCIIRAQLLTPIHAALQRQPANLLVAPEFTLPLNGLRQSAIYGIAHGLATPVLSQSVAYYDAYTSERLSSAALIQGLRDYFGAHTYQRVDRPGTFHYLWNEGSEVQK